MNRARAMTLVAGMATAALMGGLVAGCSPSEAEPSAETPSPTVTPTPTETGSPDEAVILETYYKFWAADVESQRGNPDPALFDGNATGPLVEEKIAEAGQAKEMGMVREGEPTFTQVAVEVVGEKATVSACVDYTAWVVPGAGGVAPGVFPGGTELTKSEAGWLVTAYVDPPADLTC